MATAGMTSDRQSSGFNSLSQFDKDSAKIIGKGGYGRVHAMKFLADGTLYAVKSVNIAIIVHLASDDNEAEKLKESIFNEAKLMRKLQHNNIVKVFGSFLVGNDDSGVFYIVMELCLGGSLQKWIEASEGSFPEEQVLDWCGQLLSGLKYLHENKILHRDIKADNVLLDKDHRVAKIGDFGISKVSAKTAISARTAIGTTSHMPPEILTGQTFVWQSDVWSLGVVIFNICAKKLPFPANPNAPGLTINAIIDEKVPIPAIPVQYSKELMRAITIKMLVRDPKKRSTVVELCGTTPFKSYVRKWDPAFDQAIAKEEYAQIEQQLKQLKAEKTAMQRQIALLTAENEKLRMQASTIDALKAENMSLKQKMAAMAGQRDQEDLEKTQLFSKRPEKTEALSRNLFEATKRRNLAEMKRLLASGADVNWKTKNDQGHSALMWAAGTGDCEIVSILLSNGADINAQSGIDATPLMWAASSGQYSAVELLLKRGANSKMTDEDGKTALWYAVEGGHSAVAKLLQKYTY